MEQQTATAQVLGVINSSPGDLAQVFDAILDKAHSLCGVEYGALFLIDGEQFRAVAVRGYPEKLEQLVRRPYSPEPNSPVRALLHGEALVEIPDVIAHQAEAPNPRAEVAIATGIHRVLFLPLRHNNQLLGMITAARKEARPFSAKEIALLQNFAAQAVIAMENARLLTETHEALEQQTATAEVLQVINSSPGDLAPVFDAMLERAIRLCDADFGIMLAVDGAAPRIVAERDVPASLIDFLAQHPAEIGPETFFGRAVLGRTVLHTPDMRREAAYRNGQPLTLTAVDLAGVRALLMAPLLKDDGVSGVFAIFRQEVRPFSDKQIALLQNFAAQAVIAMENARLLTETREALEQQTATAEVLQVINSSPDNLAPVFDAMLDKALHLCGAAFGTLHTYDGEYIQTVAHHGLSPTYAEFLAATPHRPAISGPIAGFLHGAPFVHFDAAESELYREGHPLPRRLVDIEGARTLLAVPLRKDLALVGMIVIYRREVLPFSEKQITLLQNFAAQAVIAMENARLLGELRQRTEEVSEPKP